MFFVHIGLGVDLSALTSAPLFVVALIVIAIAGKLIGAGVPALLAGFGPRDAAIVGVGMSARGAVELIVISIAYKAGLFNQPAAGDPIVTHLYSALVLMAVVTTLVTPLLLRALMRQK